MLIFNLFLGVSRFVLDVLGLENLADDMLLV